MKQYLRFLFLFFLLAGVILIFSGCGTEPSTQMTIEKDFSGQRSMSCTLSSNDVSQISGGEAALDALIPVSYTHLYATVDRFATAARMG